MSPPAPHRLTRLGVVVALSVPTTLAALQPPPKPVGPKVAMTIPLGAAPGTLTRLTIRGKKLDGATALRFTDPKTVVKILSKGPAPVPDKNPDRVGDTQIVAEVTLPAGTTGPVTFTVATPAGETPPHRLLVETTIPVVAEKEPNNGFRQAQKIQLPQAVDGLIAQPKDVDVYRFEGKAGQKIVCELLAARHGSGLDSLLTLYDARGRQLASNDDFGDSTDSRIQVTLPAAGAYFVAVMDAHDQGGPEHPYRLIVREEK